jgi:2'-5' RNA ligase
MSYNIDPELEYFLGISLTKEETTLLTKIRQQLEDRDHLSSPPHITVKPPFMYHFEKPLLEQLSKWAKRQKTFPVEFKKIGSFKHPKYDTVFLAPERARLLRKVEQDLTQSIRFLSKAENYTPHLTIANKIAHESLEDVKQKIRSLDLSFEIVIDNITLFEHQRSKPWKIKEIFYFSRGA